MELEDDLPPDEGVADAIDAPVEDAPVDDTPPPAPTVDDLASEMGWRPKDEWRGDPDKWKPAHEFMRATVDVNRKLANRLKDVDDKLDRVVRTSATITERELARQRQELLEKRREAVDLGDHAALDAADEALQALPKLEPVDTPAPEVADFVERNPWFGKDRDATVWAQNRAGELAKQGISEARQISIVEREAKGLFPELFPEPKAKAKAADLTPPGNRGGKSAAKGFSSLPADVRNVALEYEKRGVCSKEQYAATYYEEGGV